MNKIKRMILNTFLTGCLILFMISCDSSTQLTLPFVKVTQGTIVDRIQTTGRVEAISKEIVRARESVRIEKISVNEGDTVSSGQQLVDIDLTLANDELQTARLKLEQADIELLRAENQLKTPERAYADPAESELLLLQKQSAHQTILIEKQTIEREFDIIKELYEVGSESLAKLQHHEDLLKQAEIKLAQSEKEVKETSQSVRNKDKTTVNRDRIEASYELALRQQRLAAAQLQLATDRFNRLRMTSPINGTVTAVHVEPGMTIAPGQPIITISNLGKLRIRATVDEIDGGRLSTNQKAIVSFEAFPAQQFTGQVSWVAPRAIMRDMRTLVEALIQLDSSTDLLKISNQVEVEIIAAEKQDVLLLPLNVLYHDPKPFVWLYEDGLAVKTPVITGISDMRHIEITSGLNAEAKVIYDRNHQLSDQSPVIEAK